MPRRDRDAQSRTVRRSRLRERHASAVRSDEEITTAVKAYTKAVKCITQAGVFDAFGQKGDIQEGELVTFQKTLARARAMVKGK